jgi:hypothetical protein
MPDPRISDTDLIGLTRAYLTRRRGQPAPRDLESNALSFAFTRGRAKRLAAVMGVTAIALASALTAGVVLAFHRQEQPGGATGSTTQAQVRIVRFPGNLLLAPLDRTVRHATIVAALASDIESLPAYPSDERCPADSGTYYSLTFTLAGSSPWTAKVDVTGCEVVQVPGHPTQWAAHTPRLWSDLNDALGIDPRNLPPPDSDAGTVVGGIQLRCSPPSSSPATGVQFIAGSVDVYIGSHWVQNQPLYEMAAVAAGAKFTFVLPPGDYVLMAVDPGSFFIGPYVTVAVKARETVTANIPFPRACK